MSATASLSKSSFKVAFGQCVKRIQYIRNARNVTSSDILARRKSTIGAHTWARCKPPPPSPQPLFFRCFASAAATDEGNKYERIRSIVMNDDGFCSGILPGGEYMYRDGEGGDRRMVRVEQYLGHFWMLKDLDQNKGKPILANKSLIPIDNAQMLPPLEGLQDIAGESVSIPACLLEDRGEIANDKTVARSGPTAVAGCTLLGVSFKEYGYAMLPGWIEPFKAAVGASAEASVFNLSIVEGGMFYRLLKPFIVKNVVRSTPEDERKSSLIYFGYANEFRDALRMHNTLTAYVILLDAKGRIRWMGSGKATTEEIDVLLKCTEQLLSQG